MRGVVPALLAALLPATTAEVLCYYSTLLGEDELVKVLEGNVVDLTPYGLTDECNLPPDRTSNVAMTVEGFFVTAYGVVALQAKHADGDWSDICVRAGPEEEGSDARLDDGAPCGAPYVPAGEVGGQWEFRVDGRDYTRLCVDFLCEIGFALQFKVEGDVLTAPSPPPSCEPSRLIGRWVEVANNTQNGGSGTYIPVGVEPAEMASDTDWRTAVLGMYNESGFEFGDADGDADDDDDDDSEVRGLHHLEPLAPAMEQAAGVPMSSGSRVYVSGSSRVDWQWTWLVRDTCGAVAQLRTYLLAQTDKPSEHPCCLPELEMTEGEAHGRCKSGPCTCSSDACDGTPHMPPRPPPPPPSPGPPPPRPPRPPSPGLPKWVEPSADSKDEYYAKWRNATIAASVIGGVTALFCAGLFLYCCCCRRRATPKTNRFTGADVREGRGSSKASKALGGKSSYRPRDVDQNAASERTTPKFKPHEWESKRRSHGSFTAEVDMCEATVSNSAPAVWPPHPQPPGFSV